MRKPLEKAAKALLRYPKTKRCVQTRDQSLAIQSNPRSLLLEPLQVECPFKLRPQNQVDPKKKLPSVEENKSSVPKSDAGAAESCQPFSSVPSPPGLPLVGCLFDFIKSGGGSQLHEHSRQRHCQLGPIYKENIAGQEVLYVSDPSFYADVTRYEGNFPASFKPDAFKLYHSETDSVRNDGVFFKEDEDWWALRKPLNDTMLKRLNCNKTLPLVMSSFEQYLTEVLQKWEGIVKSRSGNLPNVETELFELGFAGAARVVLGNQFVTNWGRLNKDLSFVLHAAENVTKENCKMLAFPASVAKKFRTKTWKNFEKSMAELVQTCKDISELCAIDVVKNSSNPDFGYHEGGILYRLHTEANLPVKSMTDAACGFLATPDPISTTLKWIFFCLGRHPKVQEQIYQEIQQVCGPKTPVTSFHLEDLKFVKMTLKEVMRLYPSAPFLARNLQEESIIGGYKIPAKQIVALSLYTSHRDAKYFRDPLLFWPERWSRKADDNSSSPNNHKLAGVMEPSAFRPFGFGKRSCVGKIFAEATMQLIIARTVQQFRLHSEEVQPVMKTLLLPDRPLTVNLEKRDTPA
ncbi:unnamed protein product [Allacma fusca]|uniref:Cytochrome P450 n=1 Tax=Allacma fusca TaxID=39272 RepID=A0A8J2P8R5_9HEXA|nr:unnamed protein product [Allacma fusca]